MKSKCKINWLFFARGNIEIGLKSLLFDLLLLDHELIKHGSVVRLSHKLKWNIGQNAKKAKSKSKRAISSRIE